MYILVTITINLSCVWHFLHFSRWFAFPIPLSGSSTMSEELPFVCPVLCTHIVKPVYVAHGYNELCPISNFLKIPAKIQCISHFIYQSAPSVLWDIPLLATMFLLRRATNFAITEYKLVKKLLDCILTATREPCVHPALRDLVASHCASLATM